MLEKKKEEAEQAVCQGDTKERAEENQYIYRMGHDIRISINAILGMTMVAAHHIEDKERVVECLNDIVLSSQHMLSLVDEVMELSRLENDQEQQERKQFSILEVFKEAVQMVSGMIEEHGHQLVTEFQPLCHENVYGTRSHLMQVLMNLLGNAIKYTPDGGRIRLFLTEKEGFCDGLAHYEMKIEDNGIGMSEEFIQHIFEPFTREKNVRSGEIAGTGLGMTIVQNLVHAMNGEIHIKSKAGKGTCFRVDIALPVAEKGKIG